MPDLAEGAVFAGHRIEGVAGRGGMGTVYRATHIALDHMVALKVIAADLAGDESFRERFKSESRIAVSLRHPNVVPIHHAGEEDGLLFVTMDLVDGPDLRKLLIARGALEPGVAIAILEQVAAALDVAHSRGLVHRDIKPGNILIEERAGDDHVYLTDFGLTKRMDQASAASGLTSTGAFVGTLDYVAPEQIRGDRLDARTDVYALGCVFYEMLTTNAPFADREEKVAKMYAHLQDDPVPLEGDLARFNEVIGRSIAKDREDRYPSAGDLARAAAAAAEGEVVTEQERSVGVGAAAPTEVYETPTETERPPAATVEATGETVAAAAAGAAARPEVAAATEAAARPEARTAAEAEAATSAQAQEPQPGKSRGRLPATLLLLLVLGAVAGGAVLLLGSDDPTAPPSGQTGGAGQTGEGGSGGPTSTLAPTVGVQTRVGAITVGVAAASVNGLPGVWVVPRDEDGVAFVDPANGQAGSLFPIAEGGSGGEDITVAEGQLWITLPKFGDGAVAVVPTFSDVAAAQIPVPAEPRGITTAEGLVWVTSRAAGTVVTLDPADGAQAQPATVASGLTTPHGIAVDGEIVWVSEREANRVRRIDLSSATSTEIPVGLNPKGIAVVGDEIWVANTDSGTISFLDPADGSELRPPAEVGGRPRALTLGFGGVWVSNGGPEATDDGYVSVFDRKTSELIEGELDVPGSPEGIAAGEEQLWVTTGFDDGVVPIDPR